MAIHSIAYLICDQADEDLSITVSDKIISRVIEELKEPVVKLNNSITTAKSFLDTMLQQQASELINLQDSVKQHSDLAKTIADSLDKLNQATTRGLDDLVQPLFLPSGPQIHDPTQPLSFTAAMLSYCESVSQ